MRERIGEALKRIEREHDGRILFACESGSRAWGFASPDSDYDVRFIYAKPLDWHLKLERRPDTIEWMAPDKLDLSGWELGKALRLFAGCNLALNEWFDSPEVYRAAAGFRESMRALIPGYFNAKKALHHYRSMAEKTLGDHLDGTTVGIKKAFYILRPLLACRWIIDTGAMPPTRFDALLGQALAPACSRAIQELLVRKARAAEGEKISLAPVLLDWIADSRALVEQAFPSLAPAPRCDWGPLNRIMRQSLLA